VDFSKIYTDKITIALESPRYKWRTLNGIAKESGLPINVVVNVLTTNTDTFLRSSTPAKSGEPLFTTRKHYLETASSGEKILGALKNRIV